MGVIDPFGEYRVLNFLDQLGFLKEQPLFRQRTKNQNVSE